MKLQRKCAEYGCGLLTTATYCTSHTQARNAEHMAGPTRWVYRDPRWKRLSARTLAEEPTCRCSEDCHPGGCTKPSDHADHIVPITEGGAPFDRANTQGLAHGCHSRKTLNETRERITF